MQLVNNPEKFLSLPAGFPHLPGSSLTAAALADAVTTWHLRSTDLSAFLSASQHAVTEAIATTRASDTRLAQELYASP